MISCKYVISFGYGDVYETAFLQTEELSYASFYNLDKKPGGLERIINRLAFSRKLSFLGKKALAKLSFYMRANSFIRIFEEMNLPGKTSCIILSSVYRIWEDYGFFDYLRERIPQVKIVYFLTDIVESSPQMKEIAENTCKANIVISYDKNDANKYGFYYHPVPYSDIYDRYSSQPLKYDVCFVGANKGRIKQIEEAYEYLNECGLKCEFYVIGTDTNDSHFQGIKFCDYISYNEYLKIEAQSRCILEIVQENCVGNTFRVPEAIFLKKRLITNNEGLSDTECYYSNNMFIFHNIHDINSEFLKLPIDDYPENVKDYLLPETFLKMVDKWLD